MNRLFQAVSKQTEGLPFAFWILWLSILLDWTGKFVSIFLAFYLAEALKLEAGTVTILIALTGIASIPAPMIGGILADRVGHKQMVITGYVLTACSLIFLSSVGDVISLKRIFNIRLFELLLVLRCIFLVLKHLYLLLSITL